MPYLSNIIFCDYPMVYKLFNQLLILLHNLIVFIGVVENTVNVSYFLTYLLTFLSLLTYIYITINTNRYEIKLHL